ncbi:hypothetical protein PCC79_02680 [Propioniciclava soli]|uniref:Uncharacterized protein n=1 Tax=Propioniciclava soli TaxID=2775081 RepID=A0ABZ3C8M6_9ACTN
MNKRLWSLFAGISFLTAAVFLASLEQGLGWSPILVAALSALALLVGALIAPTRWRTSEEDKLPQQEWELRKLAQVVVAALVAVVAAFFFSVSPGLAGMMGIVAAIMVGALPRQRVRGTDS